VREATEAAAARGGRPRSRTRTPSNGSLLKESSFGGGSGGSGGGGGQGGFRDGGGNGLSLDDGRQLGASQPISDQGGGGDYGAYTSGSKRPSLSHPGPGPPDQHSYPLSPGARGHDGGGGVGYDGGRGGGGSYNPTVYTPSGGKSSSLLSRPSSARAGYGPAGSMGSTYAPSHRLDTGMHLGGISLDSGRQLSARQPISSSGGHHGRADRPETDRPFETAGGRASSARGAGASAEYFYGDATPAVAGAGAGDRRHAVRDGYAGGRSGGRGGEFGHSQSVPASPTSRGGSAGNLSAYYGVDAGAGSRGTGTRTEMGTGMGMGMPGSGGDSASVNPSSYRGEYAHPSGDAPRLEGSTGSLGSGNSHPTPWTLDTKP
jgi:hypothetical protein